ncbi:MAG: RNA 3'-terminal phosphate cyclase [Desulfococcaceae bacterium]
MIDIDGSKGEGGGQILRTALGLSMVTGKPFQMTRIRAGRKKPGLMRQHRTALRAAVEVSGARVTGDALGATTIAFAPGRVRPGAYRFDVGTAGSCTLVFQTVLPALILADGPSRLTLSGGTHNPQAPPFEFLETIFLPLLERMGPRITVRLERPGFFPAGGGRFTAEITPAERLSPLTLEDPGPVQSRSIRAVVAGLPRHIAERELKTAREALKWPAEIGSAEEIGEAEGPGNVLMLSAMFQNGGDMETGFGRKGVPAEKVAREAAKRLRNFLTAGVPVGRHLADQLLLPLALAGGGRFRTVPPTGHTRSQAEIIGRFLDVPIEIAPEGEGSGKKAKVWIVRVG